MGQGSLRAGIGSWVCGDRQSREVAVETQVRHEGRCDLRVSQTLLLGVEKRWH